MKPNCKNNDVTLGGQFTFPGTSLTINRIGYGAMQLAGPGVWGPPKDCKGAVAVLRQAIESGVNHIDTSDFYGPHVTNQIIREALHPYPKGLVIVSKVGARRPPDRNDPDGQHHPHDHHLAAVPQAREPQQGDQAAG